MATFAASASTRKARPANVIINMCTFSRICYLRMKPMPLSGSWFDSIWRNRWMCPIVILPPTMLTMSDRSHGFDFQLILLQPCLAISPTAEGLIDAKICSVATKTRTQKFASQIMLLLRWVLWRYFWMHMGRVGEEALTVKTRSKRFHHRIICFPLRRNIPPFAACWLSCGSFTKPAYCEIYLTKILFSFTVKFTVWSLIKRSVCGAEWAMCELVKVVSAHWWKLLFGCKVFQSEFNCCEL